jgi:hypothetical protein
MVNNSIYARVTKYHGKKKEKNKFSIREKTLKKPIDKP